MTHPNPLQQMLEQQLAFQLSLHGVHPKDMVPAERADYVRTCTLALGAELHEALDEIGWKPWATSQHFNRDAYVSELVDAWHFLMNLLLVADVSGDEFMLKYRAKLEKNRKRQVDGYDGVSSKCPSCRRDFDDDGVDCVRATNVVLGWCAYNNVSVD